MKFDLPAMVREDARRQRRNVGAIVIRGISVTRSIEEELRRIIVQVVRHWSAAAQSTILPMYGNELAAMRFVRDDANDNLQAAIAGTADDASRLVVTLGANVGEWVVRVERWHQGRWTDGVQSATGFNIGSLVSSLDAAEEVVAFTEWSSSLIRNVSDDMRRRVEAATFKGVANQEPRRAVGREIAKALKIGRARANLIARDQANKLSGKLDELRHREAGIDEYRWETARDERVRDTHRRNQGKVFSWGKPPKVTGHPRTEINCRCTAQPYMAILEDFDPSLTEAEVEFA